MAEVVNVVVVFELALTLLVQTSDLRCMHAKSTSADLFKKRFCFFH
jgi:hypothetical protein